MNVWPASPQVAALVRAVVAKDLEGARLALAQGAHPDCVHIGGGCSVLSIAVRHRNQEMVELLLGAGANPAFPVPPVNNQVKDPSGLPLLYEITNALATACTGKQVRLLASMLQVPACKLHAEVVKKIAYTWAMHPKIPNHVFETLRTKARHARAPMPTAVELLQATVTHRIKQRTQDVVDLYAVPDHANASSMHAMAPLRPDPDLLRRSLETVEAETNASALQVLLEHWHKVAPTKTGKWEVIHGVALGAIRVGNAPVLALVLPDLMERLSAQSRRHLVRYALPTGHIKVFNLLEKVAPKEWRSGLTPRAPDDEHPVSVWFKMAGIGENSVATVQALEKLVHDCGLPPNAPLVLHALAAKWEMAEEDKVLAVDVLVAAGADATLCDVDNKRPEQCIRKVINTNPLDAFEAKLVSARLAGLWADNAPTQGAKPRF